MEDISLYHFYPDFRYPVSATEYVYDDIHMYTNQLARVQFLQQWHLKTTQMETI